MQPPRASRRRALFLVLAIAFVVGGCLDTYRSKSPHRVQEDMTPAQASAVPRPVALPDAGADTDSSTGASEADREEASMEDHEALAELIASKLMEEASPSVAGAEDAAAKHADAFFADFDALTAEQNLRLSPKACRQRLHEHHVDFETPNRDTPLVTTPIVLRGPIEGVRIAPRWSKGASVKAVMDCHLAVALIDAAKVAKQLGIREILFYSTYRPLKAPPKKCAKGRAGRRCRQRKKAYAKARRSQVSQHRFGRAIDIGWLVTAEGETLDVLESFERRSGVPPCSYTPKTEASRLMTDFACRIHRLRIFNVMLTPNANKAHHNHFHFDITPKASWYIIR